jgi:cytochrome P450 family 138
MYASDSSDMQHIPPGPRLPRAVQGLLFVTARRRTMAALRRRYGATYTMSLPLFGDTVMTSDPVLIKQLFTTSTDVAGNMANNLGSVLGPGSSFALDGEEHRRQRKLLTPPFAGRKMRAYEGIIEEETLRESETWPLGTRFPVMEPMMRITLNAILRAVFGAEGAQFEALRKLLPPMIVLGSRLEMLGFLRRDLGPWSPWGRYLAYRREFDSIVDEIIALRRAEGDLAGRNDVLTILLQSRYDDGQPMEQRAIADQLLTLLAAGHETTATTLAWALERLSRHPAVTARLTAEVDAGGSELRQATILEVQRTRPVIDLTGRDVVAARMPLGEWVLPRGHSVMVAIDQVHNDESVFPDAGTFDPDRFLGGNVDHYAWVPFGGGTRRCLGAAFASMEMDVVLRTLLREFELAGTYEPDEPMHNRGIAWVPRDGGQVVVHRRTPAVVVQDTAVTAAPV